MDERTLERLAELMYNHTHTTYCMLMTTIQTEPEFVWRTVRDVELRVDDSHPFHQKAADFLEKIWQLLYTQIQDERELITEMCDAVAKVDPAAAGILGVIVDCCEEKLNEIRLCASSSEINLD